VYLYTAHLNKKLIRCRVSAKQHESRAVARKPRDAEVVLFRFKFADNIHYKFKSSQAKQVAKLLSPASERLCECELASVVGLADQLSRNGTQLCVRVSVHWHQYRYWSSRLVLASSYIIHVDPGPPTMRLQQQH